MSPAAEEILQRLDGTRQRWWICTLLSTVVLAVCVSLGILLAFMLADALIRFSQASLAVMFGLWLVVTAGLLLLVGRRLARSQRSLEATARRVEIEFPELGSELINLVQFASDAQSGDPAFREAAVRHAVGRVSGVSFDRAAARESRWTRFLHCMQTPRDMLESLALLAVLGGVALVCQMLIPTWGSAANRLLTPWRFVPASGSVTILHVSPGNTEVVVGSNLEIRAAIRNPDATPHQAKLFVAPEGEAETVVAMAANEDFTVFRATLPSILKPVQYRLEIGDSQTEAYSVKVREKPTIAEVEVTLHYPPYLRRPPETTVQKNADLEAPQYTVAELKVRPSAPVASGYVAIEGQRIPGRVEEGGKVLVVKLPLLRDSAFQIFLLNDAGHGDSDPRVHRIHVLPDKPPTVELLKPPREGSAAPGEHVAVMIRATDDHGLGRVWLEMKTRDADDAVTVEGKAVSPRQGETSPRQAEGDKNAAPERTPADAPPAKAREWTDLGGNAAVVLNHRVELPADKFKPGQSVMLRAVAADQRDFADPDWKIDLRPQETATVWHVVKLVSAEAKAQAVVENAESLRAQLWKILERQIRARLRAAGIRQQAGAAERAAAAAEVRTDQIALQKSAADLAASIRETDADERRAIRRVLNRLALGEMLQAVQWADALVQQATADGFDAPVARLLASQDKIIEILRKILDAARQAQHEALAEMKKRPGGDLPDDSKKKLQDVKAKLDEFLKQQKKIIEASENLAKKPTEDFSQEEEQLLKQLAQAEDDWAKFMKDLQTDLSKLPEQDFSNPSVAKELNEIQTELKMAEDALLKKSADIAVPLEQLGYERAEEMTTNLEKWLPDTPDRERWSQEESLSDADKEAPAAELPGELEDLIGELMEEEEDLFDEMEDVTSSAMDSLDKGAGWDAADGPISNMSARGVTGNRLPNSSEIGGRAGEGRQGRSSGEFVGDEAVGRGGRKTPSRLTPDPVVKGQIKDHSKDPTGGATGGGKESGQGGEGLEGPARNSPGKRDLQRLAGKQATLRNKAESIDAQFQIARFHRAELKKMIDAMAQIEAELKAGHYQNALRLKQVFLEKANNVKQYLEGEFQVRQDATANLPSDIQKEILGGMQDPSPPGWEELNRQYFDRLTNAAGAAPPAGRPELSAPSAPSH